MEWGRIKIFDHESEALELQMRGWEAACCRFTCLIHTPFPPLSFPTLAPPLEILVELYVRASDSLWVRGLAPGLGSRRRAAISTLMISSQCNISICFSISSFSLAFSDTSLAHFVARHKVSDRGHTKQLNSEQVSFVWFFFEQWQKSMQRRLSLQGVHCIDPLPLSAVL